MEDSKKINAEETEAKDTDGVTEETCAEDTESVAVDEEKSDDNKSDCKKASDEKLCRGDKKKLKKAEAEIAELKKALDAKNVEAAELSDKYLRLIAEFDNYKRRTAKERESDRDEAQLSVLTDILPVIDNLERAAQYNTEDMGETPMGKGLELTLKSFMDIMEKLGVKEIEALGKPFDPNFHNAVMHVEDENYGESEIVEVFMKGYAKGDRVLRYSMVKVAN